MVKKNLHKVAELVAYITGSGVVLYRKHTAVLQSGLFEPCKISGTCP